MTIDRLQIIPLVDAMLCPDCESIGNDPNRCPHCAGTNLLPLAPVLNRQQPRPSAIPLLGVIG